MENLRKYKPHLLELALVLACYFVYLLTRGLVYPDTTATGIANAREIAALEQGFGFFWEPGWQEWALRQSRALAVFFNWVYIVTYWPVILLFGMALFFGDRSTYYYYRTVILISLIFALVTFVLEKCSVRLKGDATGNSTKVTKAKIRLIRITVR